jgi:hypothetical protein
MARLDGLRVLRSAIHGYGVVATRAFAPGEVVCHGDGVLYGDDAEFDDTYALALDMPGPDGAEVPVFWDLVDQTRWINHSCEPNTEIESSWDPATEQLHAWWVATRAIAVGEELTYDYAFGPEVAEPCACGAGACRGVIVDLEPAALAELPAHLRPHLRPHLHVHVAS